VGAKRDVDPRLLGGGHIHRLSLHIQTLVMNYNITVIESVWRRIRRTQRASTAVWREKLWDSWSAALAHYNKHKLK